MQDLIKKSLKLWLGGIFAVLLIFLDQWTKQLAVLHLKNASSIPLIADIFELSYLENHGAAFGILQGQKTFLILITCVSMVVVIYLYVRIPNEKHYFYLYLTLILLIAGAIGNFIDRCMHDYVIDFFYFKLIDFPVFNVADIYVTTAAVIFIVTFLFYYKEEEMDLLFERIAIWKRKEKH